MSTSLLFLSGAGLPAWIWDDARGVLDRPDVVGQYPKEGTLADCATAVLAAAPDCFIVVAHSLGGVIGAQLVAQAPERIEGFVGVAALIPPVGRSLLGALPFPNRLVVGLAMRLAGTRPPEKAIRSALASDLDPAQADRIVSEFSPESQRLYRDSVGARIFPQLRGCVLTQADHELPTAIQEKSAATLGPPGPAHCRPVTFRCWPTPRRSAPRWPSSWGDAAASARRNEPRPGADGAVRRWSPGMPCSGDRHRYASLPDDSLIADGLGLTDRMTAPDQWARGRASL